MNDASAAYPCSFFCEHTPSKSRVHALVRHTAGPDTLTAILTVNGADLAERACRALGGALHATPGPVLRAEIEQIKHVLPAAPGASFTQALDHLAHRTWPIPTTPPWPGLDEHDEEREVPQRLADEVARTPHNAHLEDHPGPVVRIGHLVEIHVHDTERLLLAATAAGCRTGDDDQDDPNEETRLLDAVMHLADQQGPIPGTDTITMESIGQILTPGGQEVADWSEEPVTFDFGTGYLLESEHNTDEDTDAWGALKRPRPDYQALFPIPACGHPDDDLAGCEAHERFILTPRSAAVLSDALTSLADWCRTDINEHGDNPAEPDNEWYVFDQLPRITWRQDSTWRRRFAQAAEYLATDLDHGKPPRPTCTAEEIALHLAFEETEAVLEMAEEDEDYAATLYATLPEHPQDYNWDLCKDICLQDSDVLFLYDDAADGIEDPETSINKTFRIGDLRPGHWFDTFNNMPARQPDTQHPQDIDS